MTRVDLVAMATGPTALLDLAFGGLDMLYNRIHAKLTLSGGKVLQTDNTSPGKQKHISTAFVEPTATAM